MKNSTEMADMHAFHVTDNKKRVRNTLRSAQARLNKYLQQGSINMQESIIAMKLYRIHVLEGQDVKLEAILRENRRRSNGPLATIKVINN
jgi:hypothetical protein